MYNYEDFSVPCWKYSHHTTSINNVLGAGKLLQILNLTTLALSIARATRSDSICISVGVTG